MMTKARKKVWILLMLCMVLVFGSSINAYAYVDESAGAETVMETTTEAVAVEEELTNEPEDESTEETEDTGAFSESGNLSLLDDVGTDKVKELEYMTVQTKSGAVFYLVIDHSTDTENVYFLNQVDTADLMAIMDDSEKQEYESSLEAEKEVSETIVEEIPETEEETIEEEPSVQTDNLALFGVIGVVAVAVIGGYAFIKKKRKKDGADLEEDLEFYDDEEYENEDEQEVEFVNLEEEE